jgi:hypothetical protein
MTPEEKNRQRELLRIALLRVLEANGTRFGLAPFGINLHIGMYGFTGASLADIAWELDYLHDKGFVELVAKQISPENTTWRINAAGRDWLAANA